MNKHRWWRVLGPVCLLGNFETRIIIISWSKKLIQTLFFWMVREAYSSVTSSGPNSSRSDSQNLRNPPQPSHMSRRRGTRWVTQPSPCTARAAPRTSRASARTLFGHKSPFTWKRSSGALQSILPADRCAGEGVHLRGILMLPRHPQPSSYSPRGITV